MRRNYWSCSKFADWIRGIKKPDYADMETWESWKAQPRNLRFWIAEEVLDKLQDFVYWPVDTAYSIKYYVINRWVDQSHALVAHTKHIKPGSYRDFDYRILVCLFDELTDFVEIEKAYCNFRWDAEKMKTIRWWQGGMWRTRTWRNAEEGIKHLEWETGLTNEEWLPADEKDKSEPTAQALAAREILELYRWWTEIRPNRPDPMDVSGYKEYFDNRRKEGKSIFSEGDSEGRKKIFDKNNEIETTYWEEDTEMLIRLIKIRAHLWT